MPTSRSNNQRPECVSRLVCGRAAFVYSIVSSAVIATILLLLTRQSALASPTTARQVKKVVAGWLSTDAAPLGAQLGARVGKPKVFKNSEGVVQFFVVPLKPSGYVIVSGDDLVEPIIVFSSSGRYADDPRNPLRTFLRSDLGSRIAEARSIARSSSRIAFSGDARFSIAQRKWRRFSRPRAALASVSSVSDPRVDPLIQSRWDQGFDTSNVDYLYNYYTPNHWWSGCVATALAQIMRYHQFPIAGVGTATFPIYINGTPSSNSLVGGERTRLEDGEW